MCGRSACTLAPQQLRNEVVRQLLSSNSNDSGAGDAPLAPFDDARRGGASGENKLVTSSAEQSLKWCDEEKYQVCWV